MPTGSGAFSDKASVYPVILEMPLLYKMPKPVEAWVGAEITRCPRCGQSCWVNEAVKRAQSEPHRIALCSDCAAREREIQARS